MKLNKTTIDEILGAEWQRPRLLAEGEGEGDGAGAGGGDGGGEGGAGGGDAPWFEKVEGISDDNKEYLKRVGVKDLDGALAHGRNAEKKLGIPADRVLMLPDVGYDQDPEAWKDVVAKLGGVPDSPEGYAFKGADKIFGDNTERLKTVQEGFAKRGVPVPFAEAAIGVYEDLAAQEMEAQKLRGEAAASEATGALKKEWGAAFDDKVEAARGVLEDESDAFADFLTENGLNNHPHIIKLLAEVGEARAETSSLPGRRDGGGRGKMTHEEMEGQLAEFDDKWADALNNAGHQLHEAKKKERIAIIRRATG